MDLIRFLNLEYFFQKIYEILTGTGNFVALGDTSFFDRVAFLWNLAVPYLKTISTYTSLILLTLIIYSYIRIKQIKAEEKRKFEAHFIPEDNGLIENEKWQRIINLVNSENTNDWRQAIIGADVILDELITKAGHRGENLGEKLKSIDKSDLLTLNQAWDAHKVRNRIAHDGADFVLTERETKRVIGLYEQVFKELGFI